MTSSGQHPHQLRPAGLPATTQPSHPTQWYKHAVFYEVLVRAYLDTTGSGSGDFDGLTQKLDYIQWLGVDCLWVPPFYASPLRDGGYDVADYQAVLPEFGTMQSFTAFVDAAHARGLKIVTDLVMNHTSDQHPWFQESRRNPDGPYGDFYVWSDTDDKYSDARIIFVDTEESNWSFDPVRRQFYWHRFFSHQPDLNFENPKVRDAMLDVVRYWLNVGIDGFRLDAVPYLFEEEGSSCENLPATHDFLAEVRRVVDEEFPGRVLLAEANQLPGDVVEYFGSEESPECHMCFHFPVMPRLFYALRSGTAAPVLDILASTPKIPSFGQWGTFLRNHDELTLEMVTEEERAALYGWYAQDPRMRANVGIRRRLATLLHNSRPEIELIHALILSLPGSPCLYYGDEIGMGDNIWLNDRDAVRTPMQWTPDRNAGFSTADPGKLYLPTITSLVHHYTSVNVEAQQSSPSSLLHWLRHILAIRKAHPAFAVGAFEPLDATSDAVLAFQRSMRGEPGYDDETLVVVANMSQHAVSTEVCFREPLEGRCVDTFSGNAFPIAPDGSLHVTLGPRGFYWLQIQAS